MVMGCVFTWVRFYLHGYTGTYTYRASCVCVCVYSTERYRGTDLKELECGGVHACVGVEKQRN